MELPRVDLGDASPLEVSLVAKEHVGTGMDAGLPADVRFLNACVTAIRSRQSVDPDDQGIAVFVRGALPKELSPVSGFEYLDTGLHVLSGRIFGASQALTGVQAATLVPGIDSLNPWLHDSGLGGLTTVVYAPNPTGNNLFFYRTGTDNSSEKLPYRITGLVSLLPEEVEQFISEIHMELFVTPDVVSEGLPLWKNSSKHWPHSNAELTIQGQLRGAFSRTFPGVSALPEEDTVAGRLDLRLVAKAAHGARPSVGLLELKVLRSFGNAGSSYSSAKTQDWIDKGVDQAFSYGAVVGSPWATVCCFDMRVDPDVKVLDPAAVKAAKLKVRLKHWPIYNHPIKLRAAMVAAALASSAPED